MFKKYTVIYKLPNGTLGIRYLETHELKPSVEEFTVWENICFIFDGWHKAVESGNTAIVKVTRADGRWSFGYTYEEIPGNEVLLRFAGTLEETND